MKHNVKIGVFKKELGNVHYKEYKFKEDGVKIIKYDPISSENIELFKKGEIKTMKLYKLLKKGSVKEVRKKSLVKEYRERYLDRTLYFKKGFYYKQDMLEELIYRNVDKIIFEVK